MTPAPLPAGPAAPAAAPPPPPPPPPSLHPPAPLPAARAALTIAAAAAALAISKLYSSLGTPPAALQDTLPRHPHPGPAPPSHPSTSSHWAPPLTSLSPARAISSDAMQPALPRLPPRPPPSPPVHWVQVREGQSGSAGSEEEEEEEEEEGVELAACVLLQLGDAGPPGCPAPLPPCAPHTRTWRAQEGSDLAWQDLVWLRRHSGLTPPALRYAPQQQQQQQQRRQRRQQQWQEHRQQQRAWECAQRAVQSLAAVPGDASCCPAPCHGEMRGRAPAIFIPQRRCQGPPAWVKDLRLPSLQLNKEPGHRPPPAAPHPLSAMTPAPPHFNPQPSPPPSPTNCQATPSSTPSSTPSCNPTPPSSRDPTPLPASTRAPGPTLAPAALPVLAPAAAGCPQPVPSQPWAPPASASSGCSTSSAAAGDPRAPGSGHLGPARSRPCSTPGPGQLPGWPCMESPPSPWLLLPIMVAKRSRRADSASEPVFSSPLQPGSPGSSSNTAATILTNGAAGGGSSREGEQPERGEEEGEEKEGEEGGRGGGGEGGGGGGGGRRRRRGGGGEEEEERRRRRRRRRTLPASPTAPTSAYLGTLQLTS
ncbi:hypothetical protein V8C86DRAFT_3128258 [Haematococcus lacustris]